MQSLLANRSRAFVVFFVAALATSSISADARAAEPSGSERHYIYVVAPGIRNYLEFGGAGILVFDMEKDHALSSASRRPRVSRRSRRTSRASLPTAAPSDSSSPRSRGPIALTCSPKRSFG